MIKKYTPTKIQEIIDEGSVKDKAILFLRDRMGYFQYDLNFILDFGVPEELTNSVAPEDQQEWNEYISKGLRIENAFRDLNRFMMNANKYREDLYRTIAYLLDMEEIEEMTTELLLMVGKHSKLNIKGEKEGKMTRELRRANGEWVLMGREFSHIDPKITEDGTIDLHLTKRGEEDQFPTLRDRMSFEHERSRDWMVRFLLFAEAMRRRFKQFDLHLPEYDQLISAYTKVLDKPQSGSMRFQGLQDRRLFHLGGYKDSGETPYPAMRELIEDYSLNINDIDPRINENEELIIKYYKSI